MHCLTRADISHYRHCRSSVIFFCLAKGKRNFGNFFGFNTASVINIWCEFNLVWSICVTTEADLSTGQSKIIGVQRPWQIKGGRELTRQSHLFVTPEMMSLRSCRISSYVNDPLMGCPNLQIMQFFLHCPKRLWPSPPFPFEHLVVFLTDWEALCTALKIGQCSW